MQNLASILLEDPLNNSPPVWENSLSQILISNKKARHGLEGGGDEGWSCICRTEGKKLASLGPFHYLRKIISPILTSVSVKQGNNIYYCC